MPNFETKCVGPDTAEKVMELVRDLVLEDWRVYGWEGVVRQGCAHDTCEIYLVRPKPLDGKCLLPDDELSGGREA